MKKVYTRQKHDKKFTYYTGDQKITDAKILERITALAIPPAWQQVQIAATSAAKVQATGVDKAGRIQSIYSPEFRAKQEAAKFSRILCFAEQLPGLRKQVEHDLTLRALSKEKVLACIIKLMDQAYFRVGNQNYAQQHQTYGITTLRRKHADIHSASVTFDFVGKSGQQHIKTINDRQIARIIKQLDELPGYEIFQYIDDQKQVHQITSSDVNAYIKQHMGDDFTAKDFRTWGGTLVATAELAVAKAAKTEKDRKKVVTACIKKVSRQLGDTPAIARASYVNPQVIEAYLHTDALTEFASAVEKCKPKKYMKPEEICTLELLKKYS